MFLKKKFSVDRVGVHEFVIIVTLLSTSERIFSVTIEFFNDLYAK